MHTFLCVKSVVIVVIAHGKGKVVYKRLYGSEKLTDATMLYRPLTLLLLFTSPASCFVGATARLAVHRTRSLSMSEDPTSSPFIQAINKFQEAIQTSPAAAVKKNLAKLQAGNYDEVEVRAKLDELLAQPAVMFSFTT